ncbi:MAG: STAS/SEC14 domain-containing protein [Sphingomonas sp.]
MLTLEPSPASFMRIGASGRLTADDYDRFEPAFAAELGRRTPPVPLLLDMRGFAGWTPAGLLRDLAWDVRNRRTFSRIAVIGDRWWHGWITTAGAPLFRAPMKFFRNADQAFNWLSSRAR